MRETREMRNIESCRRRAVCRRRRRWLLPNGHHSERRSDRTDPKGLARCMSTESRIFSIWCMFWWPGDMRGPKGSIAGGRERRGDGQHKRLGRRCVLQCERRNQNVYTIYIFLFFFFVFSGARILVGYVAHVDFGLYCEMVLAGQAATGPSAYHFSFGHHVSNFDHTDRSQCGEQATTTTTTKVISFQM